MDDIDRAQEREQEIRADALAERRRRVQSAAPGDWERASATHCDACGEPIPLDRRRVLPGVRLCVVCATEEELRR